MLSSLNKMINGSTFALILLLGGSLTLAGCPTADDDDDATGDDDDATGDDDDSINPAILGEWTCSNEILGTEDYEDSWSVRDCTLSVTEGLDEDQYLGALAFSWKNWQAPASSEEAPDYHSLVEASYIVVGRAYENGEYTDDWTLSADVRWFDQLGDATPEEGTLLPEALFGTCELVSEDVLSCGALFSFMDGYLDETIEFSRAD